ncbi:DUF3182 family protein [Falsiroseomonas sp. HW251]|uniref:DUF3182 family protein n=1 Tax=Falsiroseomonas sp. HW251 TaxID=3390998 RepID=UPI003D3177E9
MHGAARGVVVLYESQERARARQHERATHEAIARRLASLMRFEYAGEYDPLARYPGPVYVVSVVG